MSRFILIFIFVFTCLQAGSDIENQIKNTSKKMNSFHETYKSISEKMTQNAKAILQQKQEILKQEKYLKELTTELIEKEHFYGANTTKLKGLKRTQDALKKEQSSIEDNLIFTIAQAVSISMILDEKYSVSQESLIEFEVLQSMLANTKEKAKKLNEKFYANAKNIDVLSVQAHALEAQITNIDTKRKSLQTTQKANKESLKKLQIAEASYKKELQNVLNKQDELKQTLARLNIIKIDEIRKAEEEKARKEAFSSKKVVSDENASAVKKHGSSYQAIKTQEYEGPKTIPPLEAYTITKHYGTYTDPIYQIKIFNESISLKPKEADAKVQTVFNGKVIYADKTAVLNNIVIIEHENGLHTIYANLSQISPNIQTGKKIKKGSTIGRVNDELLFEVTQRSFHINPIRLFQ